MIKAATKNLHVPLSSSLHERLRAEADRAKRPATDLAREAIDGWLVQRQRRLTYDAIQSYARQAAGTTDDLDPQLQAAAIDQLLASEPYTGGRK